MFQPGKFDRDKFIGHREFISNTNLWVSMMAEFIGTAILVLIGCGSTIKWVTKLNPDADLVQIGLAFGVTVAVVVQCICHVSGGHINPAVTVGCFAVGDVSLVRFFAYIIAQSIGAIAGSAILKALTPDSMLENTTLGATIPFDDVSDIQAVGIEAVITFLLVLTVFAVCDKERTDLKGSGPLMIGLSVATCHLFAIPYTGSGMNPARSLGPALVQNNWKRHWIYWVGPVLGGLIAAVLYRFGLRAPSVEPLTTVPEI